MANYSLVSGAQFRPFTYQELVAPVAHQQEMLDNLAEQYDKLSAQADVLEAMGSNDRDKNSGTYARYKAYSDRLREEADSLYRSGLNSESKQRLSDLRRMYNTEIVPIQNAWNKRKEEADMQIKAQIQHPELRFTRDAANTSLEEYINNPEGGFGVINLNNITAQMAQAAQTLAKQAGEGRLENIDGFTKNFITPYGIQPDLIANWQNNPEVSPTLTSMMTQVLAANGIDDKDFLNTPNGQRIMQEAIGAAQRGAWSAVGDTRQQVIEDFESRLRARTEASIAEKQAEYAAKAAAAEKASESGDMTESLYTLPMGQGQSAVVRGLNYEKSTWNQTTKKQPVREIIGYKDGKPIFDSKSMSLGELLNRKDSSKNDIEVASFWSDAPGNEGLILTTSEDGKAHRYFISAESLSAESNVKKAKELFEQANKAAKRGDMQYYNKAVKAAYRVLHAGLTIENTPDKQQLNRDQSVEKTFG